VQYALDQLIERINGYFGYHAVAAIRVLQAPISPPVLTKTKNSGGGVSLSKPDSLSESRRDQLSRRVKNNGNNLSAINRLSGPEKACAPPCDEGLSQALKRLQATFEANSGTAGTP